jgi:hypothetical protein
MSTDVVAKAIKKHPEAARFEAQLRLLGQRGGNVMARAAEIATNVKASASGMSGFVTPPEPGIVNDDPALNQRVTEAIGSKDFAAYLQARAEQTYGVSGE